MDLREANQQPDPHVCCAATCPPGNYYVSAIDGDRVYYMAGPYKTHPEALALVTKALNIAKEIDGRAWFMAWGTLNRKDGYAEPGTLNKNNLI